MLEPIKILNLVNVQLVILPVHHVVVLKDLSVLPVIKASILTKVPVVNVMEIVKLASVQLKTNVIDVTLDTS